MNRKQRRKIENELMRKNQISREAAKLAVAAWEKTTASRSLREEKEDHAAVEEVEAVAAFQDGAAVKIDVDQILSEPTEKNENYLAFLRANRDRVFHVSRDDPHASETIVVLEGDETKPRWLWSTINLIPIEEDAE